MVDSPLPDRLFFKIGDVAAIVGVKPHVLRYWETEFLGLRPMKTRGAHRVYRRKDVELALLVKQLLHDEGLTIPGAKRRLRELQRDRTRSSDAASSLEADDGLRLELLSIRAELDGLLATLHAIFHPAEDTEVVVTATVTAAVPSRVALRSEGPTR